MPVAMTAFVVQYGLVFIAAHDSDVLNHNLSITGHATWVAGPHQSRSSHSSGRSVYTQRVHLLFHARLSGVREVPSLVIAVEDPDFTFSAPANVLQFHSFQTI